LAGDCPERLVYCPSNLVGWRIYLLDTEDEGVVLKYERKYNSSSRNDQESIDEIYVRSSKANKWYNIWTTNFILLTKQIGKDPLEKDQHFDDKLACGWIIRSNLKSHLELECSERRVYIAGQRGINNVAEGADDSFFRGQKVALQDALETSQLFNEFDAFQNFLDDPDYQACTLCAGIILKKDCEEHFQTVCPLYELFCPIGCGKKYKRQEITAHIEEQCPKRNVTCSLCHSNEFWAEEIDDHKANHCPSRILVCSYNCAIPHITAAHMPIHQRDECPRRKIQCVCGLSFESRDMDEHCKLNCIYRIVGCPQGCGESMPLYKVEGHIDHFCTNRNHIYDRVEECPNGCGSTMMKKELLNHVTVHCVKRLIECTQDCGNTIAFEKLPGKSP
jgi:hypothetical protein